MKKSKKGLFDNKRVVLVVAIVLAVLSWIIVAGFINPGSNKRIANVKIDFSKRAEDYEKRDLQIVSDQSDYVYADVLVSGDGSEISGLTNTDVTVYPDYSAVTEAGVHMIPLKAEKITSGNYNINEWSVKNSDHSLTNSPITTIPLTFETVENKTFPVTVQADNVTAASGYFRDTPTSSQTEVTVSGPASELAQVAQVLAVVTEEVEATETMTFTAIELALMDAAGRPLETDLLEISPSDILEVTVPILEERTIGLAVSFIGMPQSLDMDWFNSHITYSQNSTQIVGTAAALTNLSDPYIVAELDISNLELGWESTPLNVEFPEGVRSNNNLKQITVRLNSSDMDTKTYEVSNLRVVNAPSHAKVLPIQETLTVTLLGDAEQLEELLPENIAVEIDANAITASKSGQQSIPARIIIPTADHVFAVGSYSMVCDIEVS